MPPRALMTAMKGLVLAGGKGTRLRPITYAMAKQLVPVANRPILYYALDELYQGGIRDIGVIISPETGEMIREAVGRWQPDDVNLRFIPQAEPLGLAHAVKIAQSYLGDSPFVMYLGDNLINGNLAERIADFHAHDCDAAILLKEVPNPSAFGVAELDAAGNVVRLVEKPPEPRSNLALIGVYLLTPAIFDAIERIQPSGRGELEITDALQDLIQRRGRVRSQIHPGWWLDTGKKDDLLSANQVILDAYMGHRMQGRVCSASTLTGAIDVGTGTEILNSQITGPVCIGKGCRIENAVIGPHTSIGDGCTIVNSRIANSVLLEHCHLQGLQGQMVDSLIGQHCRMVESAADSALENLSRTFLLADHSEIQTRLL